VDTVLAVHGQQLSELKAAIETSTVDIKAHVDLALLPIAKEVTAHETRIVNLEFLNMTKDKK
jgi:hypothetical protein